MEGALTLARWEEGHLGHNTHVARMGFGRECGEIIAIRIGRMVGFNILGQEVLFEGLETFEVGNVCESGEF